MHILHHCPLQVDDPACDSIVLHELQQRTISGIAAHGNYNHKVLGLSGQHAKALQVVVALRGVPQYTGCKVSDANKEGNAQGPEISGILSTICCRRSE